MSLMIRIIYAGNAEKKLEDLKVQMSVNWLYTSKRKDLLWWYDFVFSRLSMLLIAYLEQYETYPLNGYLTFLTWQCLKVINDQSHLINNYTVGTIWRYLILIWEFPCYVDLNISHPGELVSRFLQIKYTSKYNGIKPSWRFIKPIGSYISIETSFPSETCVAETGSVSRITHTTGLGLQLTMIFVID